MQLTHQQKLSFRTEGYIVIPGAVPRIMVDHALRHRECSEIGNDAYTDIWREWPGIRELDEQEAVT